MGNRWVGFSVNGLSLDELMKYPTSNGICIENVVNEYEHIFTIRLFVIVERISYM